MMNFNQMTSKRRQVGLSIAELLVAIAISILVLTALSAVFISTTKSSNEMQKATQQQESGRYASQLLLDSLAMAGYLSEFDTTPLSTPAELPDPCNSQLSQLLAALPLHVQGINGSSELDCATDIKADTDVIVVRRTSSCAIDELGCADFVAGAPHFQASLCTPSDGSGAELAHGITNESDYSIYHFKLSTNKADFVLRKTSCNASDLADIRRYLVHIYFVANNNEDGDGIPTLKRAELSAAGFTIVPLVDGIEDMQIQYGLDNNGDGIPDVYTAAPATTTDWRNAMSAKIHLLARSIEPTQNYIDNKTYVLGDKTIPAFGDNYKRHAYSTTVQFINPSWRRQ